MAITVRDVLDDELFVRTGPVVEAGENGLDNIVRWAYTNDRRDVARFLSGGELLIVEGSALLTSMDDDAIIRYVDELADIRVAGVAIELVQTVRELPAVMLRRADERGMPVIGMHVRRPFVDLCQSINTAIVRGRLLYRTQMDILSTDLRQGLSNASSPDDVATILANLFGEEVTIFDASGARLSSAGAKARTDDEDRSHDVWTFGVMDDGKPIANIEMTQRSRLFDATVRDGVERVLDERLPRIMGVDVASVTLSRMLRGPANGIAASAGEGDDEGMMMRMLGIDAYAVHIPFAVMMRTLGGDLANVAASLSERARGSIHVESMANGLVVYALASSGADVGSFEEECHAWLCELAESADVWVVVGQPSSTPQSLVNAAGMVDAALSLGEPRYGGLNRATDLALARFASISSTAAARTMLVALMLPVDVLNDETLLETLSVCFDAMDNKTAACSRLGIQRQTLYNRLDKVTRLSGVRRNEEGTWPLMLFAAKMACLRRNGRSRDGA